MATCPSGNSSLNIDASTVVRRRCELRWFEHDAVSRGDRGDHRLQRQVHGLVPRRDDPDHSERLILDAIAAEPHVQGDVAAGRAQETTEIALEVITALDDAHADRGPGVGAGGGAMEEHNGKLVGHRRSKPASTAGRRYPPSRRAMMPK